jgi:hypothetical protein
MLALPCVTHLPEVADEAEVETSAMTAEVIDVTTTNAVAPRKMVERAAEIALEKAAGKTAGVKIGTTSLGMIVEGLPNAKKKMAQSVETTTATAVPPRASLNPRPLSVKSKPTQYLNPPQLMRNGEASNGLIAPRAMASSFGNPAKRFLYTNAASFPKVRGNEACCAMARRFLSSLLNTIRVCKPTALPS